jgi:hypothetical protein
MLSDFRPTWQNTFQKKTNESDPSRADIQTIVDALAPTVLDGALESTLGPLVDLDKFYTFWVMEMLVEHWDSYHDNRNNFWIYFNPANGGRLEFIPWGIDALFAGGSQLTGEAGAPLATFLPRSMLTRRLYMNPPTQANYIAKVSEVLSTVYDEVALGAELDRMEALLTPYLPAIGTQIDAVRTRINSRRAEIEADLAGGAPPWTEPLPAAFCLNDIGEFSATFNTTWDSVGDPPNGTGSMSLTFDPNAPEGFTIWAAEAGPDGGGLVQIVGYQGFYTNFHALNIPVQRELFVPGTLDLGPFLIFVVAVDSGTGAFIPLGLGINTTITFDPGTDSSTPGAPVSGSVSGDIGGFVTLP